MAKFVKTGGQEINLPSNGLRVDKVAELIGHRECRDIFLKPFGKNFRRLTEEDEVEPEEGTEVWALEYKGYFE
jgi:hypothetical protein